MKIIFLVHEESTHSWKWVEYFENNNEVIVLKLKRTSFKFLDVLLNFVYVKKMIKKEKPDIVHSHSAGVNGILAALSGFHPFILTILGSDILIAPKSIFAKPFIKFALKKADVITTDGHNSKEAILSLGGDVKKIRMISFGVKVDKFKPVKKNWKLQKKFGLFDGLVILSLRNFYPVYDISTLLDAIPMVLKEMPVVKFLIVGNGPEDKKIRKLAKNLHITDSIEFIGSISQNEMPEVLNLADLYVSTALSDSGISLSTAEAMACGIVPIITDVADNKYWIREGENGFLFPAGNSEKLAEKIIYALKNKEIRKKISRNTRQIIVKKNNYSVEMTKMEKIYKEAIKQTKI